MSAQGLAFTAMFVLDSNTQFRPPPPRALTSATYTDDFNAVKALGRKTGSTRTDDQTALAPFWEGNASVHWNQAANQIARANHLSMSASNRLLAVLNIAMADTAFTTWSGKRSYGADPDRSDLAPGDGDPAGRHRRQSGHRLPIRPGCRSSTRRRIRNTLPDIPSLNGAAATVLLSHFDDAQTFTLTTAGSRTAPTPASRRRAPTGTTPGSGAGCTTRAPSPSAMPRARPSPTRSIRTRCNGSGVAGTSDATTGSQPARRGATGASGAFRCGVSNATGRGIKTPGFPPP